MFMNIITINEEKYIKGMFELFEQSTSGEISNQILNEYKNNPDEASARDAMNLGMMMYYACRK